MSLGRLLRRASSRASDLLTLAPGAGGPPSILDGEIIYSKNNVCVHPPEGLQGLGEHHPGYLCLYMEKDELLGATLILAWVPNSRIQRQDEEALRYITPEGSPVHKAPRPRARRTQSSGAPCRASPTEPRPPLTPQDEDILVVAQGLRGTLHISPSPEDGEKLAQGLGMDGTVPASQPAHSDSGILSAVSSQDGTEEGRELRPEAGEEEGSTELSAEGVSRDSSFDSDSEAFSSPFCLSPVSAALVDSSGSVFLEGESSSPPSVDAALRFPDSDGLLQTPRWDEPQRARALEQICGVFRVDLGHMRSLRLFFSDEACTSGQLVVASRESQYKVLHFHHGGLDKLASALQQWERCAGTRLHGQVADEKTCMKFSIRRPKLPSSETHPEESTYRRLDVAAWLRHLNERGQLEEEYKLRKAIFFGGIDVSIRGEVWPFLLRYYSPESTSEEREALRAQKRKEYAEIEQRRLSMTPEEHRAFWRNVQFTVDKDVVRTDRSSQFFRGEGNPNVESMRRILLNYAVYNPAIGYSQGMSDLVAPLLAEVLDESDTFWCFVGLMQNTIFVSSPRDEDMERQLGTASACPGLHPGLGTASDPQETGPAGVGPAGADTKHRAPHRMPVPAVPAGAAAADAPALLPAPGVAGRGRAAAALLPPLAAAVLQARVPRGRGAAHLGGLLGPLPDGLLPPLHLRGHRGHLRGRRHRAAAGYRPDAPALWKLGHAHERGAGPPEGEESAVPVPPPAPDPLQPARPVQAVRQRHVGQRVHARRGVHGPPPGGRELPLWGHGLASRLRPHPPPEEARRCPRRLWLPQIGRVPHAGRPRACGGVGMGRDRAGQGVVTTKGRCLWATRRGHFHINRKSESGRERRKPRRFPLTPSARPGSLQRGQEEGEGLVQPPAPGMCSRRGAHRGPGTSLQAGHASLSGLVLTASLATAPKTSAPQKEKVAPLISGWRGVGKLGLGHFTLCLLVCEGRCLPMSRSA
ncbi:TBC1 domain family member 16 isoform X2 [Myotis myotis]|uniref:TBC1 domain family member 16 isoform X2 n=1 Tax=Myotis myotis TaxID=51298 RepID=UPI001748A948|nr:TBC1 domain family member 16 isoform X2 [Myotis myotis]